jgi:hypothetical protein
MLHGSGILLYIGVVLFSMEHECDGDEADQICLLWGFPLACLAFISLAVGSVLNHFAWLFMEADET